MNNHSQIGDLIPYEIVHDDGKILAFITKNLNTSNREYFSGFIVVDETHLLYGLDEYQISSYLDFRIDFTNEINDDKYIFGFDDVYADYKLENIKNVLKSLVATCLPMVKNTSQSIANWFHIAKPKPTNQNVVQQMAYHFEEVAEMCQAINCPDMETALKKLKTDLLVIASIPHKADEFVKTIDKVALLDALSDQQVTSIGVGTLLGFDTTNALIEVNESNYTKFEDGKAVINEQGKITKGKNYRKPELEKFVCSLTTLPLPL